MRKKHLRLAKLLNAFHFTNAKHTDETVEGYIATWCEMKGSVEKLAEVADVLDFCFQNRHFIRKYPQVVEMMKGAEADAAFIAFHALGGIFPLRKPGQPRVAISDHLSTLLQAKADNAADEPQNQQFVGRLKTGAGKTGEAQPERPVPNRSFDPDRYPTLDRALPADRVKIRQINHEEDLLNPAMKRMTAEELAGWKQRTGEPSVKVSIDPNAPHNPDGSLNDLVILGAGRFGRPGMGRLFKGGLTPISEGTPEGTVYPTPESLAGLYDSLNDPENRSAAKALLPKDDTTEDREKRLNAEIRHTLRNNKP